MCSLFILTSALELAYGRPIENLWKDGETIDQL